MLKVPESYKTIKSLRIRIAPLYAPSVVVDISQYLDNGQVIASEKLKVQSWLHKKKDIDNIISWSKYHSDNIPNVFLKGINAVLSIVPKPVHTLSTQYHCMEIIKQTIAYLNPGQTPVVVCNQPVFALIKEIQWGYPETFGSSSYLCLFGGVHFKQCMLTIHGDLIKGSSLEKISNIYMSIIGSGTLVHTNYIKQARYCLQVSL